LNHYSFMNDFFGHHKLLSTLFFTLCYSKLFYHWLLLVMLLEVIIVYFKLFTIGYCCNPNLGFVTKTRGCKVSSQEKDPWVTSHAPESAKECEGMNPHTPKWTPMLGVGILVDFWIFRTQLQGPKPISLKSFLYHWKNIKA
jgi:hypothetical protein